MGISIYLLLLLIFYLKSATWISQFRFFSCSVNAGHCQTVKKSGIWWLVLRAGSILEHPQFSSPMSGDMSSRRTSIRTTLNSSNLFISPREICDSEEPNHSLLHSQYLLYSPEQLKFTCSTVLLPEFACSLHQHKAFR